MLAMEHPVAKPREAGEAVVAECDQLAIHRETIRQGGQFGDEAGHVPAAATPDAETPVPRHERAEPVPLRLIGIVSGGEPPASEEHWFGEPHDLLAAPEPTQAAKDRIWSAHAQPVVSGAVWSGEERSKPHALQDTAVCEVAGLDSVWI